MLSKSILKYIQSLHHKKFRDEHNVFIAEGVKVMSELLTSGKFICKIICAVDSFLSENRELFLAVDEKNILPINEDELQKISLLQTPNKVLGIFQKKEAAEAILQNKITLALDNIQDPGNLGTILRIADWFAIKDIVCSHDCADHYNPKVIQTSMGSIARVNIIYTDLENFINNNKEINVYAATLNGTSLYSFNQITEGLIIIGNESKGIKNELLNLAKNQITIPRFGGAESLNAAVAAGIILSHLVISGH